MTEVPEHLLKRAQAAKEKAASKSAEPAAPAEAAAPAAESAGDSRIPAHLLERSRAAKSKRDGGAEAPAAAAAPAATVVAPTAVVPVALPPGKPPLVFLSYASEDVEHVTQLGSELEARGLKVWRDGQGLRAGDNWYKQLESLISKVVDYVVVVQTPAMTSRIEGVFFWEIDEALKRQKTMGFAGGGQLRFLIPVRLGAGDPLPDLASLHQIEVSSAQGMDRLAASLAEDWALRASKRAAATVAA
mgnify:CR=1 FL=1